MTVKGEVLLIDREDSGIEAHAVALSKAGHSVSCTFNGKEAIKKLSEHTVDLVVSDTGLPDTDGILLLRSIKDISKDIYVVLMGEWPTIEFTKTAMSIGAYDVLCKPVEPEKLCRVVQSVIAARRYRLSQIARDPATRGEKPSPECTYDDQGLWSRTLPNGTVEIGMSASGWVASGKMVYITLPEEGAVVKECDLLFEIVSSYGKIGQVHRVLSPLSGTVIEVNENFNAELVRAVCDPCGGRCWQTPILKITVGAGP
ncbi:MAG: response regulator [Pseudomonadota bacterium]